MGKKGEGTREGDFREKAYGYRVEGWKRKR